MVAVRLEFIVNFLDAGFVTHGRMRIRLARRRFRRIGAALAMRLVKGFGLVVVRLVVEIFQRPLGRDAILVLDVLEIPLP